MKKKMIALLAGALLMLSTSSAFAFLSSNFEVYRVVWDSTSNSTFETMTDLGSLSSLQAKAGGTVLDSATSSFRNSAGFSAANVGTDLKIAYFAFNTTASGSYSGSSVFLSQFGETVAPHDNPSQWGSAGAPLKTVVTTEYAKAAAIKDASGMTSTLTAGTANTNSFKYKGYAGGTFAGYLSSPYSDISTKTLASLASGNVMDLYYFAGNNAVTGVKVLGLTTDVATGKTSIASTVPIPAAAWLLGSGLMGLVGFRRRMK